MPVYEYHCSAGHRFEKRQGFDAPASQRCEQCRRIARRVLHAPPILFKGSGFYVTDSRKPAPAESDSKSESSGDTSETKGDTSAAKETAPTTKGESSAKKEEASAKDAEATAAG